MPGPTTHNVVNNAPIVTGTASQITATYSGTTPTLSLPANVVNNSQALFFAYFSSTQLNITGDGTTYTIIYDTTTVNQGTDYNNVSGVFTAPATGNYLFSTCNIVFGAAGVTTATLTLVTSSASYILSHYSNFPATLDYPMNGAVIAAMSIGDTANMTLKMAGSTKSGALNGSGSPYDTFLSGMLLPA